MRPRNLGEVVGQAHLLAAGAPLRRLVEGAAPASVLLYGPPGTGKTTIARLMAGAGVPGTRHFVALSALSSGVKELRAVIEDARRRLDRLGREITSAGPDPATSRPHGWERELRLHTPAQGRGWSSRSDYPM